MLRLGAQPALVLVLAVGLLGAGCSSPEAAPRASPPSPSSTAPSASSAAPRPSTYPQAELALRPCLALDARDLAFLRITDEGKEETSQNGISCHWKVGDQNVSLDLDVPKSQAHTMTKNGRITEVPVGPHTAIQSEYQRICFTYVALHDPERLIGATAIPEPGAPQEGVCPAGASVIAAALIHIQ